MLKVVQKQAAPLFTIKELETMAQAFGGQCKGFIMASEISNATGAKDDAARADAVLEIHDSFTNKFALYLLQSHGPKIANVFTDAYERACKTPLFEIVDPKKR